MPAVPSSIERHLVVDCGLIHRPAFLPPLEQLFTDDMFNRRIIDRPFSLVCEGTCFFFLTLRVTRLNRLIGPQLDCCFPTRPSVFAVEGRDFGLKTAADCRICLKLFSSSQRDDGRVFR